MLGGGWGVSRSAPPSLEAMSACSWSKTAVIATRRRIYTHKDSEQLVGVLHTQRLIATRRRITHTETEARPGRPFPHSVHLRQPPPEPARTPSDCAPVASSAWGIASRPQRPFHSHPPPPAPPDPPSPLTPPPPPHPPPPPPPPPSCRMLAPRDRVPQGAPPGAPGRGVGHHIVGCVVAVVASSIRHLV